MTSSPTSSFAGVDETLVSQTMTNTQGAEVEIPAEFVCPITLQLMNHPLVNKRGVSFERSAILKWLSASDGHCPLTRIPMSVSDLIRNRPLESKIAFWRKSNGIQEPEEEAEESAISMVGFVPISHATLDKILNERNGSTTPSQATNTARTPSERASMRRHSSLRTVADNARSTTSSDAVDIALNQQSERANMRRHSSLRTVDDNLRSTAADGLKTSSSHDLTMTALLRRQKSERLRKVVAQIDSSAIAASQSRNVVSVPSEENSMKRHSSMRTVTDHGRILAVDELKASSSHEPTRVAAIRRQESERRRKFLTQVLNMAAREVSEKPKL